MKPLSPPYVPGSTDAERMDNAVRRMFSISAKLNGSVNTQSGNGQQRVKVCLPAQ